MPALNFQKWLDRGSDTFFNDDFDSFLKSIHLPLRMITRSDEILITDPAMLRQGFDAWAKMLREQRVTHMIRKATDVELLPDGTIAGEYETDLLSGATRVTPPFRSRALLVEIDGLWKASEISTGMVNRSFPITVPRVPPDGGEL